MNYAQYLENYYNGNERNIYSMIIQEVSIKLYGKKVSVYYLYVLNLITYEVVYLEIFKENVSESQVNNLLELLHTSVMKNEEQDSKLFLMTNSKFKQFTNETFLNLVNDLQIYHHSYTGTTNFPIIEISRYFFTGLTRMRMELNKFHSKDVVTWTKV